MEELQRCESWSVDMVKNEKYLSIKEDNASILESILFVNICNFTANKLIIHNQNDERFKNDWFSSTITL